MFVEEVPIHALVQYSSFYLHLYFEHILGNEWFTLIYIYQNKIRYFEKVKYLTTVCRVDIINENVFVQKDLYL